MPISPNHRKAIAAMCAEFVPVAWMLLAEHRDQLTKDTERDVRLAITILRRIHEDLSTHK